MRKMIATALLCLLCASIGFLNGCSNTVKGIGQDVENSGRDIQHAVTH